MRQREKFEKLFQNRCERKCHLQFNEEYLRRVRWDMQELSKDQLEMAVMGQFMFTTSDNDREIITNYHTVTITAIVTAHAQNHVLTIESKWLTTYHCVWEQSFLHLKSFLRVSKVMKKFCHTLYQNLSHC